MKTKLFICIVVLQCVWVIAMSVVHERALATGQVVLLETRPVDPRDLLRGDYVTLNYKISDVPRGLFSPPLVKDSGNGATVYVALEQRGGFYEVSRASTTRFEPESGEVVVKGVVSGPSWMAQTTNSLRVKYGLERYYVAEGTGNPRGKVTVRAVVPPSGQASIKEVFVDGKPYAQAMREAGQ